jgi:DNA-binding transcriptional regulator YiaG
VPTVLRQCRDELRLSQAAFAARLGVALETYRTWDAGRRVTPAAIERRAHALAGHPDEHQLLPLAVLAGMVGVHVRTLHLAARLGRLTVDYDTRTTFRRLRPRATLAAAFTFRAMHYRKHGRRGPVPPPLTWDDVPADWSGQIRRLRAQLGLSQAQFAAAIGAARKAVVYQWESRKRCPSPVFWKRIEQLRQREANLATGSGEHSLGRHAERSQSTCR